jgi:solute carrier family 13 (sodium-dependent dicarboxylate transporter), member 2/3/5
LSKQLSRETIGLVLGPAVFAVILVLPLPGLPTAAGRMMATAALMAIWWVTEAIPLAATSLLPLFLFPVLDLGTAAQAAAPYSNHLVYLFLGGFMLAQAMQRWNLHKRMALHIVHRIGASPSRIVLGFMCATAFVSAWVSNTATAAMMMPIGLSVIQQVADAVEKGRAAGETIDVDLRPGRFHFGVCLMLGIAYGASIGGLATLIGTPPNVLLAGVMQETYGIEISFLKWLGFGLPLAVVYLPLAWLWLTRVAYPLELRAIPGGTDQIRNELERLGPMSTGEKRLAMVFGLAAAAWTFAPLWTRWVPNGDKIEDSTIAIAATILLFVLPAGGGTGERILDWAWATKLPWNVLLLFGGGFSLAAGLERSGLSQWVGGQLTLFQGAPLPLFIALVALLLVILTEFASNTASAAMSIPILGATATSLGMSPLLLAIPATIAASCAFMLPAATPPNAIVFGTGYFTIPQMLKAGIGVNLIGIVLVTLFTLLLVRPIFGI